MKTLRDEIKEILIESILHSKKVIKWPYSTTITRLEELFHRWEKEKDYCDQSTRVDGKLHSWRFDGDDPWVICSFCKERRRQ